MPMAFQDASNHTDERRPHLFGSTHRSRYMPVGFADVAGSPLTAAAGAGCANLANLASLSRVPTRTLDPVDFLLDASPVVRV